MGERALIVFKDTHGHSPAVYLHWGGSDVGDLLAGAAQNLRAGDAGYACARFVGHCHDRMPGGLSLGLFNTPEDGKPDSHGDAGVFIVDVNTGEVETYGGYGFAPNPPELPLQLGQF